ncbi:MAG TPA: sigma-54-dependent Fis family transcriptional regulator, partial [Caldithrix abyssi]|nr:sigma-54-dependent Fis family transcriptional regulator [Caldithrix abyssi]
MKDFTILVVDDEKIQRESLVGFLKKKKYRTLAADSGERALELIDRHAVDLVLSDVKMTGISGYQLLREIKSRNPDIAVVMMTAFGEIADAVQAMKDGAFDYLTKPIDLDELEVIIERAERLNHLISENRQLKAS